MGIANWITLSRIFLGPLFTYYVIAGKNYNMDASPFIMALICLVLIEISDGIDGFVARKTKTVTDLGKYLDPLADSMSRLAIFLGFLLIDLIPWWMFLVFLYRDIIVSGVRIFAIKEGSVVSARISGKLKAIFQAIGSFVVVITALVLFKDYSVDSGGVPAMSKQFAQLQTISFWAIGLPALFTAWSAWDYVSGNWAAIKKNMEVKES